MLSNGTYQIPARWQAGLSNGANVGEIIGLFLNGWISERFGYRYTVMACVSNPRLAFFTRQYPALTMSTIANNKLLLTHL